MTLGATNNMCAYRVYADGTVLNEDEFDEADHSIPYYDDYVTYNIPLALFEYIAENN